MLRGCSLRKASCAFLSQSFSVHVRPLIHILELASEGALRSFCLHKHAWKLIDSIDGAKSSAIIYSITETAKANNLNPFRYLNHVLTVLKDHQDDTDYSFIAELLPWSDQLPESCRSRFKTTNL